MTTSNPSVGAPPDPTAAAVPTTPCAGGSSPASGLYTWAQSSGGGRAQLRLDVDGLFPLQTVSGSELMGLTQRVDWMARPLTLTQGPNGPMWSGPITYKQGNDFLFQYNKVQIERNGQLLRVTFVGGGPELTRDYSFSSPTFRNVEFEYDAEEGIVPITQIGTHDHPHRPGALAKEDLTIEAVYQRAGFSVAMSPRGTVPLQAAGDDRRWSNAEMHDAMQVYWSKFADRPQWAMWTLFAGLHEEGESLGGIMFDDIGPQERQGTSLFLKSFIAQAPPNDPAPAAWVKRMAFWTAVHEMGHSFNLAHAWDKAAGPWRPTAGGYDQLTFMNYPYLYRTGLFSNANTVAFFNEFGFRFTDDELLFMRHAPEHFVEMGDAAWFDHHGFEQATLSPDPQLKLTVRLNRKTNAFEYLEPVVAELKLTNVGQDPCLIPDSVLRFHDLLTVVIKRNGQAANQWKPYAHHCWTSRPKVLNPGESVYEPLFLSAGHGGWQIADPGFYQIQVGLRLNGEDIISDPLAIRMAPPLDYHQAYLAQDYFSNDVGRVLSFDGTQYLTSANATLQTLATEYAGTNAGIHAAVAVAAPRIRPFKRYTPDGTTELPADPDSVRQLQQVLSADAQTANKAANTLGHIDYRYYTERVSDAQGEAGNIREANTSRQMLVNTLNRRQVLRTVVADVADKMQEEKMARTKATSRPKAAFTHPRARLKFTLTVADGVQVNSLQVEDTILYHEDLVPFEEETGVFKGEIEFDPITSELTIDLLASGTAYREITFNFTRASNDKKVYDEDQTLQIDGHGRGHFRDESAKYPLA